MTTARAPIQPQGFLGFPRHIAARAFIRLVGNTRVTLKVAPGRPAVVRCERSQGSLAA
jgi:hypothetical protein